MSLAVQISIKNQIAMPNKIINKEIKILIKMKIYKILIIKIKIKTRKFRMKIIKTKTKKTLK